MKKLLLILLVLITIVSTASAASLSLSLNSLEAISEGDTITLTATVSAVGDSVANTSLQLGALPAGTATSDSLVQTIGTLSSGQSSSKSWTIRGDVAGNYTFNVTASGTSVSDTFQNASLIVNTAAFIEVSNKTCSATTTSTGNTITMNFIVKNVGGSPATVTINMSGYTSNFTLTSGSASSSSTLSAGSQSSKSYVFTATTAGTPTITAGITSTKNDPTDQTCPITITSTTSPTTPTGNTVGGHVRDCSSDSNCNDNNPCTVDTCTNNSCKYVNTLNETTCGTDKVCNEGNCILKTTNPILDKNTPGTDGDTNKKLGETDTQGTNYGQNGEGTTPFDSTWIIVIIVALVIIGGIVYFILQKKA